MYNFKELNEFLNTFTDKEIRDFLDKKVKISYLIGTDYTYIPKAAKAFGLSASTMRCTFDRAVESRDIVCGRDFIYGKYYYYKIIRQKCIAQKFDDGSNVYPGPLVASRLITPKCIIKLGLFMPLHSEKFMSMVKELGLDEFIKKRRKEKISRISEVKKEGKNLTEDSDVKPIYETTKEEEKYMLDLGRAFQKGDIEGVMFAATNLVNIKNEYIAELEKVKNDSFNEAIAVFTKLCKAQGKIVTVV